MLEQLAQRSCGCLVFGDAQCQVGWGLGQPDIVAGHSAHRTGLVNK